MDRLLIFRSGALGDFLLTIPILAALRKSAHVTLVTRPSYGKLSWDWELADETLDIDCARWTPLFTASEAVPESLSEWLLGFTAVHAWMTDADGNFSRHLRKVHPHSFYLHPPVVAPTGLHATDQLADGLPQVEFTVAAKLKSTIPPRLAIHLGSGSSQKNWPVEHWKALLHALASARPELALLIITGPADETVRAQLPFIRQSLPTSVTEAHTWPLPALAHALSDCTAYVGHDTGISHLAALCGLPSLWLFGPTEPSVWAPRRSNVRVLPAPGGNLTALSAAHVFENLTQLIPTSKLSGP